MNVLDEPPFGFFIAETPDAAEPVFEFKIDSDLIAYVMSHPDRWQARLMVVQTPSLHVLLMAVSIHDDDGCPFQVFKILDSYRRGLLARVLDVGMVDVRFLDFADRRMAEMTLELSPEPGCRILLGRRDLDVPPDRRSENEIVEGARALYAQVGFLAPTESNHGLLPLVRFETVSRQEVESTPSSSTKVPIVGKAGPVGPNTVRRLGKQDEGAYLEYDIAEILMRVFPPEWVFVGPWIFGTADEVCDVLVVTATDILVVQCKKRKHKPVGSAAERADVLRERENRAREGLKQIMGSRAALQAAHLDLRFSKAPGFEGKVEHLRRVQETTGLPYEVRKETFRVSAEGKRLHLLVVLPELHAESLENLSAEAIALIRDATFPPLAIFDTLKLAGLANAVSKPTAFFSLFDRYVSWCRREGRLLDVRFTDEGNGLLPVGPSPPPPADF